MFLNPAIENYKNEESLEKNFIDYLELMNVHPNTVEYLFLINNITFLLFSRFANPFKFLNRTNDPDIQYHNIEFYENFKIHIHEIRYQTSFGKQY